jgi:hypothetical protein
MPSTIRVMPTRRWNLERLLVLVSDLVAPLVKTDDRIETSDAQTVSATESINNNTRFGARKSVVLNEPVIEVQLVEGGTLRARVGVSTIVIPLDTGRAAL